MSDDMRSGLPLDLPHVAARLFGAPLMVHPDKLTAILVGLAPRFGLAATLPAPQAMDQEDEREARPTRRYAVTADGVAIVPVVGGLVARAGRLSPMSTELRSYARIQQDLRAAVGDAAVKAIVLDLDSPGGEAAGAMEAAAAIRALRGRKPIVAAVNHAAYSAAYAIASAADRIVIPASAGVGSIGVVAAHLDASKADEKVGHRWTFVHAGERKVDGNSHEPLSDRARATIEAVVSDLYGQFVAAVAAGRNMPEDKVRATEAGIFFGEHAVAAGLADRTGTFDDAVAEALAMASAVHGPKNPERGRLPARTRSARETRMSDTEAAGGTTPEANQQEPDKTTLREQAMAEARKAEAARVEAIAALCELAGSPNAAVEFIRAGKSEAEVRAELLARKAEASAEGGEIRATRPASAGVLGAQPGTAGAVSPGAVKSSWDRVGAAAFGDKWKGF